MQNRAMCRGVSWPAPHRHCAVSILGTLWLYRNSARPIFFVLACTSRELSALRSPLCSSITLSVGGGSSTTHFLPPGSVSGRKSMSCSCLHRASRQRSAHSFCTIGLCFHLHSPTGPPIHFSVHSLRLRPGVGEFTSGFLVRLCLLVGLWSRNLFWIAVQAGKQFIFNYTAKYKVGAPPCTRALPYTFPSHA
jgi:hypothetical protein